MSKRDATGPCQIQQARPAIDVVSVVPEANRSGLP